MNKNTNKLPWTHIIKSVFSSFIGIQNKKHADQDFQSGNFTIFAVVGIIAVILFILTIITIVKIIL